MARTEIDRAVQQSLLDRLTDELPRESSDRTTNRDSSARTFRASVQRDVEWLLNTRRTMVQTTDDHPQVAQSVHQFGLPDITGFYLSAVSSRFTGLPAIFQSFGSLSLGFSGTGSLAAASASWP